MRCNRTRTGALQLAVMLILAAVALIILATLTPAAGRVGSGRSVWCLACGTTWLADAISNVVLFVPLGFALALARLGVTRAVIVGSLLSLAIELLQSVGLPPGRTAALADWLTNSLGTLLGAMIVAQHLWLLSPSVREAKGLVAGWIVAIAAMFGATSWALSPDAVSVGLESSVTPSALPFTPGYGWYSAIADSASVNGVTISHRGTGPVMATMLRTDTVHISVRVVGRDTRESLVPIVFVHAPGKRRSLAMIGERGADAVLRSALKARRIGLEVPDLSLHGVFGGDVGGVDASSVVRLRGVASAARLALSADRPDGTSNATQATLRLTPALAWTTMQTVVGTGSPIAGFVTIAWLLVWFVPLGWWSVRASTSHTHPSAPATSIHLLVALPTLAALAASVVLASWFGISHLELWQALTCVAGAIVGGVAAWYVPSTAALRGSHE